MNLIHFLCYCSWHFCLCVFDLWTNAIQEDVHLVCKQEEQQQRSQPPKQQRNDGYNRNRNNNSNNNPADDFDISMWDVPPYDAHQARARAFNMYARRHTFRGDVRGNRGNPFVGMHEQIPLQPMGSQNAAENRQQQQVNRAPTPPPPPAAAFGDLLA